MATDTKANPLRELRKRRGLTQLQAAMRLSRTNYPLDNTYLSRIERQRPERLAGQRERVKHLLDVYGYKPTDEEYQATLLETGNAPELLSEDDAPLVARFVVYINCQRLHALAAPTGIPLSQDDVKVMQKYTESLRRWRTGRGTPSDS